MYARALDALNWGHSAAAPHLYSSTSTGTSSSTVKPRYYVQLGGRGFERYVIEKRYIAGLLINRYKGLR